MLLSEKNSPIYIHMQKKHMVWVNEEKKHKATCASDHNDTKTATCAHFSMRQYPLSVLHIWAAYITTHCELCNAPPLLIFKCISLWSNYNWAFICFVPCLWGIVSLWREFSGSKTKVSQAERTFFLYCHVAQEYRLYLSDTIEKQRKFHLVVGNKNVTRWFFLVLRKFNKNLRVEKAEESVSTPWRLSWRFDSCCVSW